MFDKMLNFWNRFRHDDKGVTLVEYGIALTLAVFVGGVALTNLGTAVSAKMELATTKLNAP
jgi:pilus assembly protein Flp/PilA